MRSQLRLSELEQDVMNIVWGCGTATAADIQKALASERALKDSTVRTILSRLEEKRYLQHEVEGRTFVYSGIDHPGNVAARAVKQILDRFCHGSLESLLTGMVDNELVDPDELRRVADRLARERAGRVAGARASQKK
jgi:BlaI family transcriptional regulator, penicillinase repressor